MSVPVAYTIQIDSAIVFEAKKRNKKRKLYKMKFSTVCECCKLALLMAMVIGTDFANASSTNKAGTVPGTANILHAEIGVASPFFLNPESYDHLVTIAEDKIYSAPSRRQLTTCKLAKTCAKGNFSECDFTGCQSETSLSLPNRKLVGSLPTDLQNYLPQLSIL